MSHWCETYIGKPYIKGEFDCARLVCDVRKEVFGLPVPAEADPERADSVYKRFNQMTDGVAEYGCRVDEPVEGDAVLMMCRGRPSHIGVLCILNGEKYVLHAMENAGQVVLHKIRDLPRVNLQLEGFYRWK